MNRHSLPAAALMAALAAGSAAAADFEGGTVRLGFYDVDNGKYSVTYLAGSAVFGLGGKLSLQGDLNTSSPDYTSGDVNDLGIHLIMPLASTATVGAFFTHEDWYGTGYNQIGLEGKTEITSGSRPITLEGFLSTEDEAGGGATYNYAGIGVSAALSQQLTAFGSIASVSGGEDADALHAGIRYSTPAGLYGELSLTSVSGSSDVDTLGFVVGYDFGSGATFGQRNWISNFHGY